MHHYEINITNVKDGYRNSAIKSSREDRCVPRDPVLLLAGAGSMPISQRDRDR
jgi:hypothetical protein